jgi:predicted CoA-binding protein
LKSVRGFNGRAPVGPRRLGQAVRKRTEKRLYAAAPLLFRPAGFTFGASTTGKSMDHDSYPDSYIRGILNTVKTIAMVGISPKDVRPSYFAFKYLLERGYRMIPVNPGQVGGDILGQPVYAKLADIPEPVDMVDVFRAPQFALAIVEEALALKPRPQVIWMQLGIRNDEAARLVEANGLKVVMDRCPKIEYGRLSSEIGWMGVNTRVLTSKRPKLSGRGIQRMSLDRVTMAGGATSTATKPSSEDERP